MFYNVSSNIVSISKYFRIKNRPFIAVTLYELEFNQDLDLFYSFLVTLAKFINRFPSQNHFTQW
jgi:hypothetical protein